MTKQQLRFGFLPERRRISVTPVKDSDEYLVTEWTSTPGLGETITNIQRAATIRDANHLNNLWNKTRQPPTAMMLSLSVN